VTAAGQQPEATTSSQSTPTKSSLSRPSSSREGAEGEPLLTALLIASTEID